MDAIHQTFLVLWYILLAWNVLSAWALFAAGQRQRGMKNLGWAALAVLVILGLHAMAPNPGELAAGRSAAKARAAADGARAGPAPSAAGEPNKQPGARPSAQAPRASRASPPQQGSQQPGAAPPRESLWEALVVLLDCLLYVLLTISPLLSLVAGALLFIVRRRAMRSGQAVWEKRVYVAVMVGGMVVWGWNALRPTPSIFEERFGLYWGWKVENMDAAVFSPADRSAQVAYRGTTSLKVSFRKEAGWLILHHFPIPPAAGRYSELEFYIRKTDLKHDRLRVCLYGEGKRQCPSSEGIAITDPMLIAPADSQEWRCVRMRIEDFQLPEGGIIGIGIGKTAGVDSGVFYLDSIRLVPKIQ